MAINIILQWSANGVWKVSEAKYDISASHCRTMCQIAVLLDSVRDDDTVSPTFINRNPRNLEGMGIQHKKAGWPLQFPRRDYWHKLILERSHRNTAAYVVHSSGKLVVSASTTETAIRRHLYSPTDVSAVHNIGRVLAQRMIESGITEVLFDTLETPVDSEAVKQFTQAFYDAGVELTERPEVKKEPDIGLDYDKINAEKQQNSS